MDEIGDEIGCCSSTVGNWLERYDISTRLAAPRAVDYLPMNVDPAGYVEWKSGCETVSVHQLLVIANGADPYDVFDENYLIHHKNEIPWDNRESNLEVLSIGDHTRLHQLAWVPDEDDDLYQMYVTEKMSLHEIGEKVGASPATVSRRLKESGIDTRGYGAWSSGGDD
jgi:hypothetical protein